MPSLSVPYALGGTLTEQQRLIAQAQGKVVSTAEIENFVKDATVVLNAKQQQLANKQIRPDRMQRVVAAGDKHVAVAYWGGTLRIVNLDGQIRAEQQWEDITAMTWQGDRLIVGLSNGLVQALDLRELR